MNTCVRMGCAFCLSGSVIQLMIAEITLMSTTVYQRDRDVLLIDLTVEAINASRTVSCVMVK